MDEQQQPKKRVYTRVAHLSTPEQKAHRRKQDRGYKKAPKDTKNPHPSLDHLTPAQKKERIALQKRKSKNKKKQIKLLEKMSKQKAMATPPAAGTDPLLLAALTTLETKQDDIEAQLHAQQDASRARIVSAFERERAFAAQRRREEREERQARQKEENQAAKDRLELFIKSEKEKEDVLLKAANKRTESITRTVEKYIATNSGKKVAPNTEMKRRSKALAEAQGQPLDITLARDDYTSPTAAALVQSGTPSTDTDISEQPDEDDTFVGKSYEQEDAVEEEEDLDGHNRAPPAPVEEMTVDEEESWEDGDTPFDTDNKIGANPHSEETKALPRRLKSAFKNTSPTKPRGLFGRIRRISFGKSKTRVYEPESSSSEEEEPMDGIDREIHVVVGHGTEEELYMEWRDQYDGVFILRFNKEYALLARDPVIAKQTLHAAHVMGLKRELDPVALRKVTKAAFPGKHFPVIQDKNGNLIKDKVEEFIATLTKRLAEDVLKTKNVDPSMVKKDCVTEDERVRKQDEVEFITSP